MLELLFVTRSGAQSYLSPLLVYLPDPVIFVLCPWANANRCVTRGNGFPPASNPHPRQISAGSRAVTLKIHSCAHTAWTSDILFPGGGDVKISWSKKVDGSPPRINFSRNILFQNPHICLSTVSQSQGLPEAWLSNEDRFLTSHFLLLTIVAALELELQSLWIPDGFPISTFLSEIRFSPRRYTSFIIQSVINSSTHTKKTLSQIQNNQNPCASCCFLHIGANILSYYPNKRNNGLQNAVLTFGTEFFKSESSLKQKAGRLPTSSYSWKPSY